MEVNSLMKVQCCLGKSKLFDLYRTIISLIGLISLIKQRSSEWKSMVNVDNNNWLESVRNVKRIGQEQFQVLTREFIETS